MTVAGDALGTRIVNALGALTETQKKTMLDAWKAIANQLEFALVPVGGVIGWHKSFPNTPTLAGGFVEMNGQTLSDADSPFNGQVIPNLNGYSSGAGVSGVTGKPPLFLRGCSTADGDVSGTGQDDATAVKGLTLSPNPHQHSIPMARDDGTGNYVDRAVTYDTVDKATSAVTLTLSGDSETRPANMSVVWIMRVK